MSTNINIQNLDDIQKLRAFIRVQAKARFNIDTDLLEEALKMLWQTAKEYGMTIEIIAPDNQRLAWFTKGGAIIGAVIGFAAGSIPGAVIGAATGGLAGYASAHLTIRVQLPLPGANQYATLEVA